MSEEDHIEEDHIRERFPALHEQIAKMRPDDPALEEICSDLVALCRILKSDACDLTPQATQDLRESIRGLETEILAKVAGN